MENLKIKSPSEHKIMGRQFSAELQATMFNYLDGSKATLVILIDIGDTSPFMDFMFFGTGKLSALKEGSNGVVVQKVLNLNQVFQDKEFISYVGEDHDTEEGDQGKCMTQMYLMSFMTLQLDEKQFLEFDKSFQGLFDAVVSKGIVGMDISQNKSLGELTSSKVEEMTDKEEEDKLRVELERRKDDGDVKAQAEKVAKETIDKIKAKEAADVKAQAEKVAKETIDKIPKEVGPVKVDGA